MYKMAGQHTYWVEVDGEGPPLVMLHGFTGSTRTYDAFVELCKGNYKIIRIDLPGHGQTGAIGTVSMEEFCEDLRELINEFGMDTCSLFGYSLGGRAALSFSMIFPEKVDHLILESASPGLRTSEEREKRVKSDEALRRRMTSEGLEAFVDFWEELPLFHSQMNLSSGIKNRIREERLNQDPEGLQQSLAGMGTGAQPSWWAQLAELDVPALLITGTLDHKFQKINQKMNEELPHSHWKKIQGAGHAVHVEKPSIIPEIVDQFMIQ